MTTIAWDGKTLAADSMSTYEDGTKMHVVKIAKSEDGFIVAVAGNFNVGLIWMRWVLAGMNPDDQPEEGKGANVIIIDPKGKAHVFENAPIRQELTVKKWALGSGYHLALGAMEMGADAVTAVRVAAKWDSQTGGRIVSFKPGAKIK